MHAQSHTHTNKYTHTNYIRMKLWDNEASVISGWQVKQRLKGHCLLALRTKLSDILRGRLISWLTWIRMTDFLADECLNNLLKTCLINDLTNFWVSKWINHWLSAWLIYWLDNLLSDCRKIYCMNDWQFIDWLTDWLSEWLIYQLTVGNPVITTGVYRKDVENIREISVCVCCSKYFPLTDRYFGKLVSAYP